MSFLSGQTFLLSVHNLICNNMIYLKQRVKGKLHVPIQLFGRGASIWCCAENRRHETCAGAPSPAWMLLQPHYASLPVPPADTAQQSVSGHCLEAERLAVARYLFREPAAALPWGWLGRRGWLRGDDLLLSVGRVSVKAWRWDKFLD